MDAERCGRPTTIRRRRRLLLAGAALLLAALLALVLGLALGLTRRDQAEPEPDFRSVFLERCEEFKGYNCQTVWNAFQQAYVNQDPYNIPTKAYDALFEAAPFTPACNRMLFWSKTKDVVHSLTKNRDCYLTLEDTMLGSVLDGLTWCGKEGSHETFTTDCPGWTDTVTGPVRSFWIRASQEFAEVACSKVTAMLNGSISVPFHPDSIFASVEVKSFDPTKVTNLNVVLVTQKNSVTNCTNESLKNLQNVLDDKIIYKCQEVQESQIEECGSDTNIACGACW